MRRSAARFENILPVEMRTIAIRRTDIVEDDQLFCVVERLEIRESRMEAEKSIQIMQRARACRLKREIAAYAGIILVAMGRRGGQSVQRAAQDYHHQPAITGRGGKRKAGLGGKRAECTRCGDGLQKRAAIKVHASPALKFGTGNQKRPGIALRLG